MDARGLVTGWNHQAELVFGWSREEALGRVLAELIIPEDYRERHRQGLANFLATGEGRVVNQRLELPALHRSGRRFPVELTISPIHTSRGYEFCAFLHDISDRKKAEDELR